MMTKSKLAEPKVETRLHAPLPWQFSRLGKGLILAQLIAIGAIAVAFLKPSVPDRLIEQVSYPFPGVTYLNRRITGHPELNMHVVKIDLTLPGLRFQVTKPTPNGTTPLETTLNFSQRVGAQIGINGNFFQFSPTANATILGAAASRGWGYGVDTQNSGLTGISFSPTSQISFLTATRKPALPIYNLVSGFSTVTMGNVRTDLLDKSKRAARSAIGLTQDGRQLILFVVDGPASGVSRGMTQLETAEHLQKDFNVYNAINLDGGGSSTLIFCQPNCRLANLPSSTVTGLGDRVVGNNLAIFVPSASPK